MNKTKILVLLAFTILVASCTTRKTFTYLQDVEIAKTYVAEQDAQFTVRAGDRLNVYVSSLFPELAAPLNGGSYQVVMPMAGSANSKTPVDANSRAKQFSGYLVNKAGYITMPVLGEVYVLGKNLAEVKEIITSKILEGKHVSDPMVEVRFANFKVYLLGAINKGETKSVSSGASMGMGSSFFTRINGVNGGVLRVYDKDKINILEALALAGDLSVEAKVDKVDVIRQTGNKYVTYRLNLKSAEIFNSPGFYLHQDDIIYIEYRYRNQQPIDRGMQLLGYGFSAISTIVSMLTLLAIYKK